MAWLKCLLPAAAALCLCTAVLCPVHAQEVSFDREQKRICIKAEATGRKKSLQSYGFAGGKDTGESDHG